MWRSILAFTAGPALVIFAMLVAVFNGAHPTMVTLIGVAGLLIIGGRLYWAGSLRLRAADLNRPGRSGDPVATALEHIAATFADDLNNRVAQVETLKSSADAAAAANRAKTEFLANISHEIRTPMNGIMGMISLLMDSPLDPEQRECARVVKSSAESLLVILNDVLDISRIESGKLELQPVSFDLVELIQDVGDLMFASAAAERLEVGVRYDPRCPSQLIGDPVRVRQILMNLVNNALKFTERGSVMLAVEVAELTATDVGLEFSVHDTGIGISEASIPQLFARFVQADSSTTREYGGAGLGLAISKQLVELMGGTITVRSTLGGGSTFRVQLRFPLGAQAAEPALRDDLGAIRAIVICEQRTLDLAIEEALSGLGVGEVITCSPAEAIGLLSPESGANQSERVALIDCDVLAGPVGQILSHRLSAYRNGLDLRVLILAPRGWERQHPSLAALAESVIHKPVLPPALSRALRGMVANAGDSVESGPPPRTPPDPVSATDPGPAAQPVVLVADDHPVNLLVARKMLEALHCSVTVVVDGQQAVAAAQARRYDLILMDCSMPVMDGYTATRTIRQSGRHSDTPIVAMTAHVLPGERERCLDCGMNDYLSKPLRQPELKKVLAQYARPRAQPT
ncbi:response regulator [candidate division KSB1 bacterium]|nr:response regulator [candidate division KSB1 bacterium]